MSRRSKYKINQDSEIDSSQYIISVNSQELFNEPNQEIPEDFPHDAYEEFKKDNKAEDFVQYEPPPVVDKARPLVKKWGK